MTYRKRAFTALVAGALALPLLATPAFAGHGGANPPPVQSIADFCTNPFPESFVDVRNTDVFAEAIQCIATADITAGGPEGKPANEYGPELNNLRGQMASFIARMLDAAEARDRAQANGAGQIQALPAYDGQNEFTDVPNNFVHVAAINRLADANIVEGGPGGAPATTYGPNQFISRAQMASFINRAAAYALGQDPRNAGTTTGYTTTNNYFVDSGEIAIHRPNINGLASAGIVVGVQPASEHRYAPRANVTRAQMAGFISRTLAQLFDDNRIHSLLEVFTGNVRAPGDANQATEVGGSRSFEVAFLNPNTEYRVTAVDCENVNRGANDLVTFERNADGTANTGNPDAVVTVTTTSTDTTPGDNTATGRPAADGTLRFTISSESEECVAAAIYLNGGAGKSLREGGTSPALEVDADGRPVEFFGITGDTTFTAPGDDAPTIVDAFVATDTGQASEADDGDFLELRFSEAVVASDGATATVTATNADGDTVEFLIVCGADPGENADAETAAACTLSADGLTLTIELLEDPQDPDSNADLDDVLYPLEITGITGINDADEGGQPVDLEASADTTIEINDDTDTSTTS